MKKLSLVMIMFMILSVPVVTVGQEAQRSSLKVGYVNLDTVLQSYQPYQEAVKSLDEYRSGLEEEIATNREEIQNLRKEIEKGGQYLSDQARQEKQQELMQRMQMFQQSRQRSQQMMNRKEQEILTPVRSRVQEAVQAVAEDGGYDVVHRFGGQQPSTVLWVAPDVDLSDEVIEKLEETSSDTESSSQ